MHSKFSQESEPFSLGLIEGFYGRAWSWQARSGMVAFMSQIGMSFYIYAPKADHYLRSRWRSLWPSDCVDKLIALRGQCQRASVSFGIALSPLEIYQDWNAGTRVQLKQKLAHIEQLKPDIMCLLFDDMRGDMPGLAQRQVEVCHFVQANSSAQTLIFCPTYYSHDPVLQTLFGAMPDDYWRELGELLDPEIEIFWTGDHVCSSSYRVESIQSMNTLFQRKLTLWDNYPVNDGKKTSPFLHLRPFSGRPATLCQHLRRHVVNPMNAAYLSQLPLLSLPALYHMDEEQRSSSCWTDVVKGLLGKDLALSILDDMQYFQDIGLENLQAAQHAALLKKYHEFNHPAAQEIVQWLQGYYRFDPACLTS